MLRGALDRLAEILAETLIQNVVHVLLCREVTKDNDLVAADIVLWRTGKRQHGAAGCSAIWDEGAVCHQHLGEGGQPERVSV